MSKRKIRNQLNILFSELNQESLEKELDTGLVDSHFRIITESSQGEISNGSEIKTYKNKQRSSSIQDFSKDPELEGLEISVQKRKTTDPTIITRSRSNTALISELSNTSVREKKPIFVNGSENKPAAFVVPRSLGEESLVLEFLRDTPAKTWTDDERLLVEQVADQLTLALENAKLFNKTEQALSAMERQAQELTVLNDMSKAFAAQLNETVILENIYKHVSLLMDTNNFYIALFDQVRDSIFFPLVYADSVLVDENHPEVKDWGQEVPVEGMTGHVIRSKKPLLVHEDVITQLQESEIDVVQIGATGAESWLGVPMLIGERVIGVLAVQSETEKQLYNEHHAELLTTIGNQAAIAIENARLLKVIQSTLLETESLYRASTLINTARTVNEILSAIIQYTEIKINAADVTIDIFDQSWTDDSQPNWIETITEEKLEILNIKRQYKISPFLQYQSHLTRNSYLEIKIPDNGVINSSLNDLIDQQTKVKSIEIFPLYVIGEMIGWLKCVYTIPHLPNDTEIRKIQALTRQASIAIQNHRLIEVTQRKADQLLTAAEIARDTSSTLALDFLLQRSVNLIRDRFGFYHASVFLLEESAPYAIVRESTGEAGEEMKRMGHKLAVGSQSVVGYVAQKGEPLVINDVSQNPIHRPNPLLPYTQSELGIPLLVGKKVIGVLDVQSTKMNAFQPDEIAILHTLADQLAVAITNAQAYEISQQAVEEMKDADRLKSQFLANMSHELRTPLNSIIGFSRVILKGIDGPITDLQKQDLNAIYNSGQHLLNLINDILDLSKIEAGKLELLFEENVQINDLIQSITPTITGLLKDKPISLVCSLDQNLPPIKADPTKIRQVLLNLLANAAKFTEQGTITIESGTIQVDGYRNVIIHIHDTGSGINEQDQEKLFQPFSQVDSSLTRKTGGSGLGLSISKKLVEMHGGSIGLISTPEHGSTFYFTLPFNKSKVKIPQKNQTILVIDNEPQIVSLYQRYTKSLDYKIEGLEGGTDIIKKIFEKQPAIIILDVAIKDKHTNDNLGWQLLRKLKGTPEAENIPIIICSILDDIDRGLKLGAASYLLKPILEDDLLQAINNCQNMASA